MTSPEFPAFRGAAFRQCRIRLKCWASATRSWTSSKLPTRNSFLAAKTMVKGAMTLIDEPRAEHLLRVTRRAADRLWRLGRQHHLRRRFVWRPRGLYRQGEKRPARRRLYRRHSRLPGCCLTPLRPTMSPGTAPLLHLCHARRRANAEHLSQRQFVPDAGRRRRGPRAAGADRLSRGLYVGSPGGQGGVPKGRQRLAHAQGHRAALTLSDSFCVGRFRAEFLDLMRSGTVDTVFANTDEVLSLYETDSFPDAIAALRKEGVLAFVTRSEKGAIAVSGDDTFETPAAKIERLARHHRRRRLFRRGLPCGPRARQELDRLHEVGRTRRRRRHPAHRRPPVASAPRALAATELAGVLLARLGDRREAARHGFA